MGFIQWIAHNWFDLFQSVGVIGALTFSAITLRLDVRVRRISNLFTITAHHRDIWMHLATRPELARVLDAVVDLKQRPITSEEEMFVNLLILHLNSAYQAMKVKMFVKPEGLRKDIRAFFALPIPRVVWDRAKPLQDEDFVRFVERDS